MTDVETGFLICVVALCRASVRMPPAGDGGRLRRFPVEEFVWSQRGLLLVGAVGRRGERRSQCLVTLHCASTTEGNRSHAPFGLNLVEQTEGNKRLCVGIGIVCLHIESAIYFCFRDIF